MGRVKSKDVKKKVKRRKRCKLCGKLFSESHILNDEVCKEHSIPDVFYSLKEGVKE